MRRKVLSLGMALGVAVLSGCGAQPEHLDGQAIPAGGMPPPSTTPSAAPTPKTSATSSKPSSKPATSKTSSAPRVGQVIGPTGIGTLKIGSNLAQARATGLITGYQSPDGSLGCGYSKLKGAGDSGGEVTHSPKLGIVAIQAYGNMHTPEGITFGSTLDQVQETYPDFEPSEVDDTGRTGDGRGWAHASGKVNYRFTFSDDKVVELGLEHKNQDCYE
jgi:hypothetical protein